MSGLLALLMSTFPSAQPLIHRDVLLPVHRRSKSPSPAPSVALLVLLDNTYNQPKVLLTHPASSRPLSGQPCHGSIYTILSGPLDPSSYSAAGNHNLHGNWNSWKPLAMGNPKRGGGQPASVAFTLLSPWRIWKSYKLRGSVGKTLAMQAWVRSPPTQKGTRWHTLSNPSCQEIPQRSLTSLRQWGLTSKVKVDRVREMTSEADLQPPHAWTHIWIHTRKQNLYELTVSLIWWAIIWYFQLHHVVFSISF